MGIRCILFAASIVVLQCMHSYCFANFTEIPSSMVINIENGTERQATFRCRHQRTEASISWQINGTSSRRYPDIVDSFVRDISGTDVDTLTIPAIPEYNGTEVVCVATFLDGSPLEVTPSADLIITGREGTMEPGFMITPSPLNMSIEEGIAVFHCQHWSSDDITWRVNGTFPSSPNISIEKCPLCDGFRSSLSIATLLVYNQTTVECGAIFFEGTSTSSQFTRLVTLLVQGIPGNITNLDCRRNYSSDTLTTFWDPLPTLNLTGRDPDIIYHVEIFTSTCGQNIPIKDENVTENGTSNRLDLMQIYTAIITPRNNVPGYIDGPSVVMQEKFMPLSGITLFELSRRSPINVRNKKPVPSYYTMMLKSLDGIGGNLQVNISVQRDGEMIRMQIGEPLLPRCLWTALILPYGCDTDRQVIELSTHDIQSVNISSNPLLPGWINVTGLLVNGSTANGIFVIVCSLTNESDVHYVTKQTKQNAFSMNARGLTGTEYGVSVFALENGLPFERVVTSPKNIAVVANNNQGGTLLQPTSIEYKLQITSIGVCITCTFLDSSTTDCVVVVHQRISQLSSSGLMNIKSSHKFTRLASSDTAYGCIEGVNLEQYQVGVVGGKMNMEPNIINKASQAGAIAAGTVLGAVVFIALMVIVVVMYVRCRARHKTLALETLPGEAGTIPPHLQPDSILNNIVGSGSAGYNHYAELAPLREDETERSAEEQPLVTPAVPPRVMSDDMSAPPVPSSADHGSHEAFQESSESSHDQGTCNPTYTQPMLPRSSNSVCLPVTEKVVYDEIHGFQNQQGQHYAIPQLKSTLKKTLDDLHQVVYIKVQPHSKPESGALDTDTASDHTETPPTDNPAHECLTTKLLFSFLLPYSSKWLSLGEALLLNESRLDEIDTNNETDEACLREMVEVYMMRSDLNHNWEEIQAAFKKIGIASVQEDNPSPNSPRISGKTMHVPGMAAKVDIDHDKEAIKEGRIHDESKEIPDERKHFSSNKPSAKEKDSEQGGNSHSGNNGSQHSELESSDDDCLPESEEDSGVLSSSEGEPESFHNRSSSISHLSYNLDDFQSGLNPSPSNQATLTGDDSGSGDFGRATEGEGLNTSVTTSPMSSNCSPAEQNCLQVERFCEKIEHQRDEDDLCKMNQIPCQDSHGHKNYYTALKWQMGLQIDQKDMDKLKHNAVEECAEECPGCTFKRQKLTNQNPTSSNKSSTLKNNHRLQLSTISCSKDTLNQKLTSLSKHINNEQLTTTNKFHTHKTSMDSTVLDIKEHDFVPVNCTFVSSKYSSPLLILVHKQMVHSFPTMYSSKPYAVIKLCSVKVHIRFHINLNSG